MPPGKQDLASTWRFLETKHSLGPRVFRSGTMLDKVTETVTETVVETDVAEGGETIAIKVTKGGTIDVDVGRLPDRIYKAVIVHGLQKLINRKTKADMDLSPDARAAKNLAAMYANTYKLVGSKAESGKASGPVMVEARRLAILIVKAEIKAQGIKLIHVPKPQLTELANQLLVDRPELVKQAEASLKAAENVAEQAKASGKLMKIVVDPKLVKAAEDKKAKAKATAGQILSAKQAGKVQVKSKPVTR